MRRTVTWLALVAAAALTAAAAPVHAEPSTPGTPDTHSTPVTHRTPDTADPAPLAGPTADELRAKVATCGTQLSNGLYAEDAGGAQTIPVCSKSGAVFWKADMDIDCDGKRTTQCNENTDPWFLPETACVESDGEYLDSAGLPFVVVPLPDSRWDHTTANIRCGTVVAVVYQDTVVYGVVGDKGPRGIIGEGSYELAERLGIDPDPRIGGVGGRVVDYIFFPGTVASPLEDQAQARSKGEAAATAFVDSAPTCADVGLDFTSYATIQVGSSGDLVKAAQCLLRTAGFDPGTLAGTFDAPTEAKVKAFQQSKGLPVDGVVARATWTALLSQGSTPTLRNGSSGADVRRLQRSLTAALGRTVGIDGLFGPLTEQAVEDYQSSRDLDVDGVVGTQTWGALQAGR